MQKSDPGSAAGIAIVESRNSAIHSHGGPGATIDKVVLHVEVKDGKSHRLEVKRVDYRWRSCNSEEWSRRPVPVANHALYSWSTATVIAPGDATGITIAAAPPQKYAVHAAFAKPFEAYNTCQIFAFDVDVEVDGTRGTYVIPLDVMREAD